MSDTAIVPFAASGPAAQLQALADERMQAERIVKFPESSAVGNVCVQQMPGVALGAYAWRAGLELVNYLERSLGTALKSSSVLELGSGTGLTAIALARLKARVVATDCMPDLVKLARKNASANQIDPENFVAQIYDWGAPRRHAALRRPFDFIIASEVTALESGHDGLLSTLRSVVDEALAEGRPPPRVFLAETRRNTQQSHFWAKAQDSFSALEVAVVEQHDAWNTMGTQEPVRIFELRPVENAKMDTAVVDEQDGSSEKAISKSMQASDLSDVSMPLAAEQAFTDVFKDEEKLDGYSMCFDDLETFVAHGYSKEDVGKLSVYGCVLHEGVPLLFKSIAKMRFQDSIRSVVDDKVFLDLGSADGRCVISAALHFVGLKEVIGIELSAARHCIAEQHRLRLSDERVRSRVRLVQDDILSDSTAALVANADIIYAANLRFPEEVNRALGGHITRSMKREKEYFVLVLASVDFSHRMPAASWEISVPMNWNPEGWPVYCHHFPANCA
eukprot:TRINITY_DN27739_c0_g1_i1.p1 TRINITY_DN27739_c0_g1~~TRINITY_DN27739_c0_g1_i1.p1  ORF type:complete len:523 (+),score=67.73 TRINITY_DN27739_c0_g1_i1:57-1571(+)